MNEKLEQLMSGPLVWLSTLHAAAEVVRSRSERARGIDASGLEDPRDARHYLQTAARDLEELAFRLGALQSEVLDDVDDLSAAVARFDALLVLNRGAQVVEDVHRRLLSLFPDVDEGLVERARLLANDCRAAVGDGEMVSADRLFSLATALRRDVLSEGF